MCFGQSYNHIPGHGSVIRKDFLALNMNQWLKDMKHCSYEAKYFPFNYILTDSNDCANFFNILNSDTY